VKLPKVGSNAKVPVRVVAAQDAIEHKTSKHTIVNNILLCFGTDMICL
jgi:hypothetical protein